MHKKTRLITTLASSAVAAVLASTHTSAADTIKLGFAVPLTGEYAPYTSVQGAKCMAEMINKEGGVNGMMFELMVQDLDRAVGQILGGIDLQETLVILVGDNGTPEKVPFAKAELGRGKTTAFEGGIRVPMVWAGAGIPAGSETSALVSFVDVLPTLAARIGVWSKAIEDLDGLSLEVRPGPAASGSFEIRWEADVPGPYHLLRDGLAYRDDVTSPLVFQQLIQCCLVGIK